MIRCFTTDDLVRWFEFEDYDIFKIAVEDVESRIKYFHIDSEIWRDNLYICKIVEGKIVGVLQYCIVKYGKTTFQGHRHFVSYVSVDENYRNIGVCKELVEYWSSNVYRSDLGQCGVSGFTESGFHFLRPVLQKLNIDLFMENSISF